MDKLPKAPEWKMQDILFDGHQTAKPIVLFYHDPLEVIWALLQNPIFGGHWDFTPRRVYDSPDHQNCIFNEWMTSDGVWDAQVGTLPTFSSM